jgi:hypothetical protein
VSSYPAVALAQGIFVYVKTADELATCKQSAWRAGYFSGMLVVGSDGLVRRVTSAVNPRGVGGLFGYGVFLQRRVKVELAFSEPIDMAVADVRASVLAALKAWWSGLPDYVRWRDRIARCDSNGDIVTVLGDLWERGRRKRDEPPP